MNNSAVHQSLIELEESLKSLESARSQVENVSEKSEQIILSFTKVLKAIEALKLDFEDEKSIFSEAISTNINSFQSTIDKESAMFVKSLKELDLHIAENVENSLKEINAFQSKIGEETGNFTSAIDHSTREFRSTLEIKSSEFGKKSDELNQNYSKAVEVSIEKLSAFDKTVDKVANKIVNFKFETEIDRLKEKLIENNNTVRELQATQIKSAKWTRTVIAFGFLAVMVILIFYI